MPIPVLPYIPSMGFRHRLLREMMTNDYGDGHYHTNDAETPFLRADGTKGISSYKGLNNFYIGYDHAMKGADKLADQLWDFFLTRLDNLNEPFYFYNPTEYSPPDLTGTATRGRYYVRLRDPNQALSREYFRNCLYNYQLELIEVRELEEEIPELPITIPIELFFTWYFENESPVRWWATEEPIDPADYPDLESAWFTAVMECDTTEAVSEDHYLQLVDADDNVYATLTIPSAVLGSHLDYRRIEPVEFTLNPNPTSYFVKMSYDGSDWCVLAGRSAKILLRLINPSRLRIQIPLLSGDESAPGCYDDGMSYDDVHWWAYAASSQNDFYGYANPSGTEMPWPFVIFKKDAGKWDNVEKWTFLVIGGFMDWTGSKVVDSARFALFNKTKDVMVTGSELTFIESDNPITDEIKTYWGDPNLAGCLPFLKSVDLANDAENFDDDDEFELRMWCEGATGFQTVALAFKACLYPTLDPSLKFQVYWRTGTDIRGTFGVGNTQYDDEARALYSSSYFPPNTLIYYECCGKEDGGNAHLFLHEVGGADYGYPAVQGHAAVVTAITGNQPPVAVGDWYNLSPEVLEEAEGSYSLNAVSYVYLAVPLATAEIELEEFDFDNLLPADAIINEVRVDTVVGVWGQAATMSAWGYVGGSPLTVHNQNAPESIVTSPPPIWSVQQYSLAYSLTADRAWTRADLLDDAFKIHVRVNHPNNSILTFYDYNEIGVTVGWHRDIAQIDFSTSVRERVRTVDIRGDLTSGYRYITHFYTESGHTINKHCMPFLIYEVDLTEYL